jgi:hypothetical protein
MASGWAKLISSPAQSQIEVNRLFPPDLRHLVNSSPNPSSSDFAEWQLRVTTRPISVVAQGSIAGLLLPREPMFWPLLEQLYADRERRVSLEVRPPPISTGARAGHPLLPECYGGPSQRRGAGQSAPQRADHPSGRERPSRDIAPRASHCGIYFRTDYSISRLISGFSCRTTSNKELWTSMWPL